MSDILSKTIYNNLNKYISGLSMGIQAFEKYIKKAEISKLKSFLQSILDVYKLHKSIIYKRLGNFKPKENYFKNLFNKITGLFQSIKNITIDSDEDVFKEALTAFEFGIEMSEKFLIENTLDEESKFIIVKFIKEERELLKSFQNFNL